MMIEGFSLAAGLPCLPKTRVWGSGFKNRTFTGASTWLSSTTRPGCGYRCDGLAVVSTVQRYYASSYGRFNTADPYQASAGPSDPGSWNRYAYVMGDPVNNYDPQGLANCSAGDPLPCTIAVNGNNPVYGPGGPFGTGGAGTSEGYSGQPAPWDAYGSKKAYRNAIQCTPVVTPDKMPAGELQQMLTATSSVVAATKAAGLDDSGIYSFLATQFLGDWNFKTQYAPGTVERIQAQNFGNFAFGAVMQSLGYSYDAAQRVAGTVQMAICTLGGGCGTGTPLGSYPYGDQIGDALMIQKGYTYERLQTNGDCPPSGP